LNETLNELRITSNGKLTISAQSLEIKVDTTAKISASNLELESTGPTKVKGMPIQLN
jgi:phage gp45-like